MENKTYDIVDSVEKLEEAIANTRKAQQIFAAYTQEQVDKIFLAAASAANKARIPLAKLAVEETGMGIVEDKVIKNNYASEYIYNAYKDTKTCGVIEEDILVKKLSEKRLAEIRNAKIGIVMQDFALVDDFSCIENVLLLLDFSKDKVPDKKEKAMQALKSVGMDSMAKKPVNKLSGGQKQRVAIARAIVNEPSIILADEPTGALDTKTADEIMELFHELNKNGHTVIIVTHDLEIANQCDRIIEISDGRII